MATGIRSSAITSASRRSTVHPVFLHEKIVSEDRTHGLTAMQEPLTVSSLRNGREEGEADDHVQSVRAAGGGGAAAARRPTGRRRGDVFALYSSVARRRACAWFRLRWRERRFRIGPATVGYRWQGRMGGVGVGSGTAYGLHGQGTRLRWAAVAPGHKLLLDPTRGGIGRRDLNTPSGHGPGAGYPWTAPTRPVRPGGFLVDERFGLGGTSGPEGPIGRHDIYETSLGFT